MARTASTVAINGRFLTREGTGVDRVACELVLALDRMLEDRAAELDDLSFELLVPVGARTLTLRHIRQSVVGRRSGHAWEQLDLARAARGRWLLNFCNTGPAFKRKSLVILHDAQVYQQPDSYSRGFRTAYRVLMPTLGRCSRIVFTVSDFSRRELERFGVVPAGKCQVTHNGCDHMDAIAADVGALEAFGLAGRPYALALGSLSPHKNLSVLFEAARLKVDAFPLLCIAGSANPKVFAASGMRETPQIRFLGRVSDEQLKALLQNAEMLLFPSLTEGFGLPPLEAMSVGCAVIAAPAEAVVEACGDAAIYADAQDAQAWASAVTRLAKDADLRGQVVAAGLAQASLFTWRASALRIVAALKKELS